MDAAGEQTVPPSAEWIDCVDNIADQPTQAAALTATTPAMVSAAE